MTKNTLEATNVPFRSLRKVAGVMKLLVFLLLLSMQVAAKDGKEKVTLAVQNEQLATVLKHLEKQTGYRFTYSTQTVPVHKSVSLQVVDKELSEVLNLLLKDLGLTYQMEADKMVVIFPKKEKAETFTIASVAADSTIKGRVTGADGSPLAGASVTVKGTRIGTTTNSAGEFELSGIKPNAVLVISSVGFEKREITLERGILERGRLSQPIALKEDVNTLQGVVVTGYQTVDRKLFTGASTKVSAKDAERTGIPDVSRMLEGQVAGVSVQNVSGTFGAAPKIRVRGATSLSGDNKPLWVVDGIILEDVVNISNEALSTGDANTLIGSSVAGLNPNDIESFTILKDAAATAMYGARAMNGVIVVTTKKGRNTEGKANVSYNGTFTTYIKPNYSQFDIMNSAEQMSVMLELENKGYFNHSQVSRSSNGGIFYKMYNQMYQYDEGSNTFALKNTPQDRLNFLQRYASANTDWFNVLFKNSLLQEHSISVSSGTSKAQNYFSTSFTNDNGQTVSDNVKRFTANFRNNFKVNERLSLEFLVNGSVRDQRTPGTLSRASDPVFGQYSRDFDINPYSYALNTSRLMTPYDENGNLEYFVRNYAPFNILNELETNYLTLNMLDFKVQGGVKYKILPQLTYSFDGAYRYAHSRRQHYVEDGSNMAESFRANGDATVANGNINLYSDPDDPNALPLVVLPEGGFYNTNDNSIKNYYVRNNLEYNANFSNDHKLNMFGSVEMRYTDRQATAFEGIGYQYNNGGLVNPNYRYFKKMIEGGDPYYEMSYGYDRFLASMFRSAYSYKGRYTLSATGRYDGSNLMGKSRVARWLPTWNISGAWDIDQEKFFNSRNNLLSGARLRATYGLVGSLGNATNSAAVFFNQVTYRPYESEKEAGIRISSLANSELTWEKLYELNLGTDLSFFNNKVDLTVDVYKRDVFDLIGSIRTSGIGGQFVKTANYGEMKAKGIEVTLGGSPVTSKNGLNWRTQFNFGINKNEITKLEVDPNIWTLVRAEGAPLLGHAQRGLFSIQFDGLDPNYGYPTYIGTEGEKDTYIYLQGTDIGYLKYHGPVDPTLAGGFFNRLSYKGLSLSGLVTFAAGNYVRLQPTTAASYNDMTAMSKDMVNRWIMPGDETKTNIPSLLDGFSNDVRVIRANGAAVSAVYPYNAYNYSTERVAKGDFVRLKNISLAYMLPNNLISRFGLSNMEVALVGNNIALLYSDDKLNGADPEFFNNGGVAMPVPKQYTFSLKLGF